MNLLIIVKHFGLYQWIVAKSYIVKFKVPSLQCSILIFNILVLNIYLILFAFKYTKDFHLMALEK